MKTAPEKSAGSKEYFAIALVSCAVLIYQIVMTRILSVVLWYHWAFLSISLAMLGLGVSGVWFTVRKPGAGLLAWLLAASSAALPLSILLIFHLGQPKANWKMLTLCIVSMTGPMILMGAAVCVLLLKAKGPWFARMYGADLLGAFLGAVCIIPLMHVLSAPQIVVLTAFLPCMAWFLLNPKHGVVCLLSAGLLGGLLWWGSPLKLQYSKVYNENNMGMIFEKWTPTARLTIFDSVFFRDHQDGFGWGMGTAYKPEERQQLWLEQDGSAGTPITAYKGNPESLSFLSYDVTAVGYLLRRPETVAIIGGGGGRDILTAHSLGAKSIDAIELNGAIIQALSDPFREFSGDVYHLPGVQAVQSEGRSYLTRTSKTFDLIQISLIDSWAATAAGAYALSENNLYTQEAFNLYFKRLAPGGILSISRWMKGSFHIEGASLVLLMEASLHKAGIENPRQHIMAIQGGSVVTVLVKLTPFSAEDLKKTASICNEKGLQQLYPDAGPRLEDNAVHRALTEGASFFIKQRLRMKPATDDRPFFFHVVPVFHRRDWPLQKVSGSTESRRTPFASR